MGQLVYELREWSDETVCLYTDDQRVKDLALSSPELQVVGRYFSPRRQGAFAWDIVGHRDTLSGIARTFLTGSGRGR